MSYELKTMYLDKTSHNLKYKYGANAKLTEITYHQTSNSAPAINERNYLNNRTDKVYIGFHFVVDESQAIQCLPLTVQTWHAGDSSGAGNMKSIGVEIARSTNSDIALRNKAIENGAKLIAKLMKENNIPMSKVKSHQSRSGKHCPHDVLDRYGENNFRNLIQAELNKLNNKQTEVEKVSIINGEWRVKVLQNTNLWLDTHYSTVGGRVTKGQTLNVTQVTENYGFFVVDGKYLVNSHKYNFVTDVWSKPIGKIQTKQKANLWSYANFDTVVGQIDAWQIKEYSQYRNGFYLIPYLGWVHESFVNKKLKLTDALVTN